MAWKNATSQSDREHVTSYMRKNLRYHPHRDYIFHFEKYQDDYNYKLSIDNIEDFLLVKQIFKKL